MKRSLAALLAAAPLLAPAAPPSGAFSLTLEPKQAHEQCARLAAGEKRNWYWRSDGPVDFDIRYREGDEVRYPVKRAGMRGDGGAFTAKAAQDYCWTWTAGAKPVKLEGRIAK